MSNSQDRTPEKGRLSLLLPILSKKISIVPTKSVFNRTAIDVDPVDLLTLSNAVKQILTRFNNPAEKNSASNLQSLAQTPEILARLMNYAEDPTEHHITVRLLLY
jgi:hypothetical protein